MTTVLFRSRFQPFTKLHYECIKGFYVDQVQDEEERPELALCVVRDYETLASTHHLLQRHKDDDSRYFRHLHFLNPFTLRECYTQIRESLFYFLEADPDFSAGNGRDSDLASDKQGAKFRRYLAEKLAIISAPIKFSELLSVLRGEYQGVLEEVRFILSRDDESAGAVEKRAIELLVRLTSENFGFVDHQDLDELGMMRWLMPVFDFEDLLDYQALKKSEYNALLYPYPGIQSAVFSTKLEGLNGVRLSHYGVFIYYIYLQLAIARKRLHPKVSHPEGEVRRVSDFIRNIVSPGCLQQFNIKVKEICTRLADIGGDKDLTEFVDRYDQFYSMAHRYLRIPEKADLEEVEKDGATIRSRLRGENLRKCLSQADIQTARIELARWTNLPPGTSDFRIELRKMYDHLESLLGSEMDPLLNHDVANSIKRLTSAKAYNSIDSGDLARVRAWLDRRSDVN